MRILHIIFIVFLSLLFVPECSFSQKPTIEIKDTAGRLVKAPVNPDRIVCLGPGSLRQIVYLGRQDMLVGIEQFEKGSAYGRPYLLANPQLTQLPVIAPGGGKNTNSDPDLEATLKVKPEVIFISYMEPAKADALQGKLGIPVVVLTQGRFAGFDERMFDSLLVAGKVLQAEERAEALIRFVREARADLEKRVGDVSSRPGPTVYVGGVGFKGQQGIESSDSDYTPLEWIKANQVVKSLNRPEHVFINKEQLLAWNPDVIFIDGSGLMPILQDYQKNQSFYMSLTAVKEASSYVLFPFVFYVANVDTAIVDAYAAGKVLYPDRFSDIDVKANADRIYSFFLNKPVYDLMEKDFGALLRNDFFGMTK